MKLGMVAERGCRYLVHMLSTDAQWQGWLCDVI